MAKYIVDIDALIKLVDLAETGKINGAPYAYTQNIKYLIANLPKTKVEETVNISVETNIVEVGE